MDTFDISHNDLKFWVNRLLQLIPQWFGEDAPNLNAILYGFSYVMAFIKYFLDYVDLQDRIQTATGENLDLIACDFFGPYVQRSPHMPDDAFRQYIRATLFAEMGTVRGMSNAIYNLTGYYPLIFEGFDDSSLSAYNNTFYYNSDSYYGGWLPYNYWITVYIKSTSNKLGGYNSPENYYNVQYPSGNYYYLNVSEYVYTIDEIMSVINRVQVAGTVPHVTIQYI